MASPDFRLPNTWRLSAGRIPIPVVPHGAARSAAIHQHYYEGITPEQWANLIWDPDNDIHWKNFFRQRRDFELVHYEGNGPPPANKNAASRKI
jgi:hypothetical protein